MCSIWNFGKDPVGGCHLFPVFFAGGRRTLTLRSRKNNQKSSESAVIRGEEVLSGSVFGYH